MSLAGKAALRRVYVVNQDEGFRSALKSVRCPWNIQGKMDIRWLDGEV